MSRREATASHPAAPRQLLPGSSSQWRSFLEDERRFPLVAASLALLGIAVAILAARLLEDTFPAFLLVCSVIGAVVGLARPYLAVLGAIVVSPTFGWVVFGPDVSAFQVLVGGAAIGCLWQLRADPALLRRVVTRPEVAVGLMFAGWLSIAAVARWDTSDWGFVRNYSGALVFLGVLAITLRTERQRATAVGALLVGVLATAVVGLAQLVTTEALVSAWVLPDLRIVQETYSRLGSSWGLGAVGSDYGKNVLVGFLIVLPLVLNGLRRSLRVSLVVIGAILAVALLMSGGRSAWLGAIAGILYVALVSRRWSIAVPAAGLTTGLALLIIHPATPINIQTAVGLPAQDERGGAVIGGVRGDLSTQMSSNLRRRLTTAGLEMVRDEPLLGVGAGAFKLHVDRYEPLPAVQEQRIDARPHLSAHNVVLELWADSGTPAVLLYILFLALILYRLERHRRDGRGLSSPLAAGLSAALIGLFVTTLFHNYQYDNLLWVICGVAASLGVYASEIGTQRTVTAR
jgi:O-antigen ligase